jgi:hypothetical protein
MSVFVARVSFLFRGMGHALGGKQIHSSQRWWRHATETCTQAIPDNKIPENVDFIPNGDIAA